MFDPSPDPRVFALPPGVDFPAALVAGLRARFAEMDPLDIPRVQLIVNTRRMARRIGELFDDGPAMLLPRIQLVTDLGEQADLDEIPPPVPPLRRRLELAQLVSHLLDAEPDLAPRASLYDLADSLATLMGEMQGEGVDPDTIARLDVSDQSGHWERSQRFLSVIGRYFADTGDAPDIEARQRQIIERLIARWTDTPPAHPVIVAGSTGSRGTTQLLMQAVARLPQGALVLPGFDRHMPEDLWQSLDDPLLSEDHPQYRYHALMKEMGLGPDKLHDWVPELPANDARNALVSLALRPAPITDQWLTEGPRLPDIAGACADMTLVEAATPRQEALTIALRLRQAAEDGKTAALITPDRMLTRQVAAALDRWNIIPDDSAGLPLQLTAIGRLMRHLAALFSTRLSADALLTLLKHPLTHQASDRGVHRRLTSELELHLRRHGPPYPEAEDLQSWANGVKDRAAGPWVAWLISTFTTAFAPGEMALTDRLAAHLDLLHTTMRGFDPNAVPHPWDHANGHKAKQVVDRLQDAADAGGAMSARDYDDLFGAVLATEEVREVETPHPLILIWGTLEARVQGADLLILAGLNEGSWPEAPAPDPWLNRKMRLDAGLLLPERRIGLSAHDFQQAIAAPEVWLTRAVKSEDAETVVSRWLNRLTNLLDGLPEYGGAQALAEMRQRGRDWIALADVLEQPGETPPAPRPAPVPPPSARLEKLSVTEIKRLIRDPYAIYAKHMLDLRPLNPLMRTPDALARGIVVHKVMEEFIRDTRDDPETRTRDTLMAIARRVLDAEIPWPAARILWLARIERVADGFLLDEERRRKWATPVAFEESGHADIPALGFRLTGTADRIDMDEAGEYHIYDYKTGTPPGKKEQQFFDKQLLLEAVISEKSGFGDLPPGRAAGAYFIGLGAKPGQVSAPLSEEPPEKVWAEFTELIGAYVTQGKGFLSRRAMFATDQTGDYDQLARFGEWDITQNPVPEVLT